MVRNGGPYGFLVPSAERNLVILAAVGRHDLFSPCDVMWATGTTRAFEARTREHRRYFFLRRRDSALSNCSFTRNFTILAIKA